MMQKKVLITGGAGYIGSVMVPALLRESCDVTVVDNFYFQQNSLIDCCLNPNFHIIRGDCRNEVLMRRAIAGMDYLIPLAALVGFPLCQYDEIAATTTNLDAVKMLLRIRSPEQRVIYPCTNSGYGVGDGDKLCTEDSPLRPLSLYGTTKVEAERAVLEAGNSLTFRFATVFGGSPRMRTDLLVNDFVYRAVFDRTAVIFEGQFKRNYIHIRDAVGAFIHAMKHFDEMQGRPYNCGLSSANLSNVTFS